MGMSTDLATSPQKSKMLKILKSIPSLVPRPILRPLSTTAARLSSENQGEKKAYRENVVTTNSDGSILICWHPEPKFPYEMTSSVPRFREAEKTASVLKTQYVDDMKELYHHKHERLVRRDLMRLTWTPKHHWDEHIYRHKPIHVTRRKALGVQYINKPREKPYAS